jgi:hypothetical protein
MCVNAQPFIVKIRSGSDIRNRPATSFPGSLIKNTIQSPPLEGEFGGSQVKIEWIVADDPENLFQW